MREVYEKVWEDPDYAKFSPGMMVMPVFRQHVWKRVPLPGQRIVDIGCGSGQALEEIASWPNIHATGIDFVDARQGNSKRRRFVNHDITLPWPFARGCWDWGFCTDVMEHIPPGHVETVLGQISEHCKRVFFSISFTHDHFGQRVGHPLHLTVQPFEWWKDTLRRFFVLGNCRDLLGMGIFYGWSQEFL